MEKTRLPDTFMRGVMLPPTNGQWSMVLVMVRHDLHFSATRHTWTKDQPSPRLNFDFVTDTAVDEHGTTTATCYLFNWPLCYHQDVARSHLRNGTFVLSEAIAREVLIDTSARSYFRRRNRRRIR